MISLLLVEDDKQLSEMYARKFTEEGFSVFVCHDGSESIQQAKEKNFDAIVLDLMLPGISGMDVLEIIRQDERTVKTPVLVYTNYGDNFNREKCLTYGADEFILKVDTTPNSLCEAIKKVINLKEVEGLETK
jgi:two-component system alkaline phosphatase synthesis response regulator PhoP